MADGEGKKKYGMGAIVAGVAISAVATSAILLGVMWWLGRPGTTSTTTPPAAQAGG